MTIDETSKLLAIIQEFDNRKVGRATILAWHEVVGDLDFDQARAAVAEHFRTSTAYLMPAHIRAIATPPADELDAIEAEDAERKARWLARAGLTPEQFEALVVSSDLWEACAAVEAEIERRGQIEAGL